MPLDLADHPRVATHDPDMIPAGCHGIRWAVARTHPQAERWANANLVRRGFKTYLPMFTAHRRDRTLPTLTHPVQCPLFPRYLFVQHDNPALWRPIRETPGVAAVLTNGNRLQYARAGAVEAVQAGLEQRASDTRQAAQWRPGDAVSLRKGHAMEGLPAVITHVAENTANVAILFLGRLCNVLVPTDCLVARDDG